MKDIAIALTMFIMSAILVAVAVNSAYSSNYTLGVRTPDCPRALKWTKDGKMRRARLPDGSVIIVIDGYHESSIAIVPSSCGW